MSRRTIRFWSLIHVSTTLLVCGCAGGIPKQVDLPASNRGVQTLVSQIPTESSKVIQTAWASDRLLSEPITFARLVEIAREVHPDLRIAYAQVEAARGRFEQAGLRFNPTLGWQASDLGSQTNQAGKEGPTITQIFVTANKLGIAQQAASFGVTAADWTAITRWYDILARLRSAYYDALAAQREVEVAKELVRIADEGLNAAQKLEKAGTGGRPDVLRAEVERDQFVNRKELAERRAEATWRLLTTATGLTELEPAPLQASLNDAVPEYEFNTLKTQVLQQSSELQSAWASVHEAEQLARRARVEPIPNLEVQLQPYYDFQGQNAGGQVTVSLPSFPIFNRNQGNILAAQAEMARTREVVRQTELRLVERLTLALQRQQASKRQVENFSKRILPNAEESLRLILLGYSKGDPKYDYTAVLQAQNILAQARLTYVQAQGELQRSVSDLEGLLQRPLEEFFLIPQK